MLFILLPDISGAPWPSHYFFIKIPSLTISPLLGECQHRHLPGVPILGQPRRNFYNHKCITQSRCLFKLPSTSKCFFFLTLILANKRRKKNKSMKYKNNFSTESTFSLENKHQWVYYQPSFNFGSFCHIKH